MSKLLFIDDDPDLVQINAKYFTKFGYEVQTCTQASIAIQHVRDYNPDCIILDVMMPDTNGFDLCRDIKTFSKVPIIFLSGVTEEDDRIQGLLLGGDDYITKPFSYKELNARIIVQLRRNVKASESRALIEASPFQLDLSSHQAYIDTTPLNLSNREFTLLQLMVSSPNEIITFEQIGKAIWQYYSESERQTIMVIASRLRKKIIDVSGRDNLIETVRSKGYKFIAK